MVRRAAPGVPRFGRCPSSLKVLVGNVDSIDYQGIADPTARVEKLVRECAGINDALILVGSSMGGHVATAAATTLGGGGPVRGLLRHTIWKGIRN